MSHPGNLYADSRQRTALKERFPLQFDCQHIGHDWPDGWHALVADVCEKVDRSGLDIRWVQIKEKFGTLRLYWTNHSRAANPFFEQIGKLIQETEEASSSTCCKCARRGYATTVGGWWLTLCVECQIHVEAYGQLPWSERDAED